MKTFIFVSFEYFGIITRIPHQDGSAVGGLGEIQRSRRECCVFGLHAFGRALPRRPLDLVLGGLWLNKQEEGIGNCQDTI